MTKWVGDSVTRLILVRNQDKRKSTYLFLFVIILLCSTTSLRSTYSYLYDSATSNKVSLHASDISKVLEILPGKAKAVFTNPGREDTVLGEDSSGFYMDFGELEKGNSKNFEDVIKLKSKATKPLHVTWYFEGTIASLLITQQGEFVLLPLNADSEKTSSVEQKVYIRSSETLNYKVYETENTTNDEDAIEKVYCSTISINMLPELFLDSSYSVVSTNYKKENLQSNNYLNVDLEQYVDIHSLNFKFKTDSKMNHGNYQGFLNIKVNGNFFAIKIPVKVMIKENTKKLSIENEVYENSLRDTDDTAIDKVDDNVYRITIEDSSNKEEYSIQEVIYKE